MPIKKEDCPFHGLVMPSSLSATHISSELESRVGKLEGQLESLVHVTAEQSKNVEILSEKFSRENAAIRDMFSDGMENIRTTFTTQLNNVSANLQTQTRPNIQLLLAGLALAGGLAAYVLSGNNANIAETKSVLANIQDKTAQVQYVDKQINTLDNKINQNIDNIKDDTKELIAQIVDLREWRLNAVAKLAQQETLAVQNEKTVIRLDEEQRRLRNTKLEMLENRILDMSLK